MYARLATPTAPTRTPISPPSTNVRLRSRRRGVTGLLAYLSVTASMPIRTIAPAARATMASDVHAYLVPAQLQSRTTQLVAAASRPMPRRSYAARAGWRGARRTDAVRAANATTPIATLT